MDFLKETVKQAKEEEQIHLCFGNSGLRKNKNS